MKKKKNELDVDFIGGQAPLTKAEEKAINEFIKSKKGKRERLRLNPKSRTINNREKYSEIEQA